MTRVRERTRNSRRGLVIAAGLIAVLAMIGSGGLDWFQPNRHSNRTITVPLPDARSVRPAPTPSYEHTLTLRIIWPDDDVFYQDLWSEYQLGQNFHHTMPAPKQPFLRLPNEPDHSQADYTRSYNGRDAVLFIAHWQKIATGSPIFSSVAKFSLIGNPRYRGRVTIKRRASGMAGCR
jgi:hypothetical protein